MTQKAMVTDGMVKAAESVYWNTTSDPEGSRDMRAALIAAFSIKEAVVEVGILEEVARAWASIDGKGNQFDQCKANPAVEDELGHFEGYMAEAHELIRRSPSLTAALAQAETQPVTDRPVIIIGWHTINQLLSGTDVETDAVVMLPASDLASPVPAKREAGVVTLEWEEEEPGWFGATTQFEFSYEIRVTDRGSIRSRYGRTNWFTFDGSLEEAKAAAQSDYERRILSALSHQPTEGASHLPFQGGFDR